MREQPLISIILPTLNGQRYLAESVESCRRQTFHDWELVIVDDGSTDATPDIIADLVQKDSRIRSLRNEVNKRIPASLNRGFATARGKYFTWTSDDNLFAETALEEMVRVLDIHPDVDIVYAGFTYIDENGGRVSDLPAQPPETLVGMCTVNCCFLYRRAVQEMLGGYREELEFVDDWDFWLRAVAHFRLKPLPKILYSFRQHPESLGVSRKEEAAAAAQRLLDNTLPGMQWADARTGARAFLILAGKARGAGDDESSRQWFWKAFRLNPSIAVQSRTKAAVKAAVKALLGPTASGAIRRVIRRSRPI